MIGGERRQQPWEQVTSSPHPQTNPMMDASLCKKPHMKTLHQEEEVATQSMKTSKKKRKNIRTKTTIISNSQREKSLKFKLKWRVTF